MANVLFKRGSQANLDTLIVNKSGVEGAFYLTEDTHRLYTGKSDGTIVPVNEGITTVATLAELPAASKANAGYFYYVTKNNDGTDLNILAVSNGKEWVQINTDTTLLSASTKVELSEKTATVTSNVADTSGKQVNNNFSITAGEGINVLVNGETITLSNAIDYDIITAEDNTKGILKLTKNDEDDTSINFIGDGGIDVSSNATGTITIKGTPSGVAEVAIANNTDSGFKVTVQGKDGEAKFGTYDPTITYGENNDQTAKLINGNFELPIYSKSEIDTKLDTAKKTANAMVFKGVVDDNNSLPTKEVSIGDTYKVGASGLYGGHACDVGDLLIANGVEESGIITGDITWEYIPSGDETDTTYKIDSVTGGIKITDSNNAPIGGLAISAGNKLEATEATDENTKVKTITINHETTTITAVELEADATQDIGGDLSFKVTAPTVDDYGHVTNIQTQTIAIKGNDISAVDSTVAQTKGSTKSATITTKVTMKNNNNKSDVVTVKSDNLSIIAENAEAIKINLEWEQF